MTGDEGAESGVGEVTSSADGRQTLLNPGADASWICEDIEQVIVLGTVSRPAAV